MDCSALESNSRASAIFLPLGGVSSIDSPGKPFHDPAADAALFDAIKKGWRSASNRKLIELGVHINDAAFADAVVAALNEIRT